MKCKDTTLPIYVGRTMYSYYEYDDSIKSWRVDGERDIKDKGREWTIELLQDNSFKLTIRASWDSSECLSSAPVLLVDTINPDNDTGNFSIALPKTVHPTARRAKLHHLLERESEILHEIAQWRFKKEMAFRSKALHENRRDELLNNGIQMDWGEIKVGDKLYHDAPLHGIMAHTVTNIFTTNANCIEVSCDESDAREGSCSKCRLILDTEFDCFDIILLAYMSRGGSDDHKWEEPNDHKWLHYGDTYYYRSAKEAQVATLCRYDRYYMDEAYRCDQHIKACVKALGDVKTRRDEMNKK